jgi:hypothetical protein
VISDSLHKRLSEDSGIAAIAGTRVFPIVIPQTVYTEATKLPCLVYTVDTNERQVTYDGTNELVEGAVEISCYSRSYKTAQSLAAAVRTCLLDFIGILQANTSPITSVRVSAIHLDGENNLMDEEPGLYRVLQRYVVWYVE